MKKQILGLLVAFSLMFSGAYSVFADGMMIKSDPYSNRWDYYNENTQQAVIDYQKGLEKMVISIDVDNQANAVWLFPVPADPTKVVIDVVDQLPQLNGQEISATAKMNLANSKDFLFNSQIYPLFFQSRRSYYDTGMSNGLAMPMASVGMKSNEAVQDVVTYEHLDKDGIMSEIVTAKTSDGLYKYFQDKGLKIEKGAIPVLDAYIGKDNYSFVASWIGSQEKPATITAQSIKENLSAWLGMSQVRKILFDLKTKYPELVGVEEAAPGVPGIDINVDGGTVLPYLQSEKGQAALDELVNGIMMDPTLSEVNISSASPRMESYPGPGGVVAKGVSVIFPTKDIYFPLLPTSVYESKIVPATIKVMGFVEPKVYQSIANFTNVGYYGNAYFYGNAGQNEFFAGSDAKRYTKIEISAPSKYLTDDLWIKNSAPSKIIYSSFIASHSLAVSILLLVICSLLAVFAAGAVLLKGLRKQPLKLALLGLANCFSLLGFVIVLFFVRTDQVVAGASSAMAKLQQKGYVWKRRLSLVLFVAAAFFLSLPFLFPYSEFPGNAYISLVLIVIALEIRRIRESDEILFADVRKAGYSTWAFRGRGENKLLFAVSFTLLFLVLAYLAVELLKLTV